MVLSFHRSMDFGEEPRWPPGGKPCHLQTLGGGLAGDSQRWLHAGPGLHCLIIELGSLRPHRVEGKDLFP